MAGGAGPDAGRESRQKIVGVYDRPAGADRRSPLIWIVAAVIVLAALYFLARHLHLFPGTHA